MQQQPAAKVKLFASCLALAFVLLAILGGVKSYSPVPYWDMWDGYIAFYTQVSQGDWSAWWLPHNEHRIVLARALFWIDMALLDGQGWFLIVTNYLLAAASVLLFWAMLKEKLGSHTSARISLSAFLCAWLFSWIQDQNFTWGFQSQFFLAQFIPLAAFYCLHKSSAVSKEGQASTAWRWFTVAAVLGTAALGTMANGVLTLPILMVLALALRMPWPKVAFLSALSTIGCTLYIYDPAGTLGGSITQLLFDNPLGVMAYTLLYLGGPFYYFFGKGTAAIHIAQVFGLFLIASCAYFLWQALRSSRGQSLNLALLAFLLYIGGTALGTASGRLSFGIMTQSRYMTPALMAWAALLVLYSPYLAQLAARGMGRRIAIPFGILLILMFARQVKAFESHQNQLFERKVAALALALQVKDQQQIAAIYPVAEHALQISKLPLEKGHSIFSQPDIQGAVGLIGSTAQAKPYTPCSGQLETIERIEGEPNYLGVSGWFGLEASDAQAVVLTSSKGMVVGYAVSGQPRPDLDKSRQRSGFQGYLLTSEAYDDLALRNLAQTCEAAPAPKPENNTGI